ncbi:MAG: ABC transporter permease, partial [Mediterranea sp.]|nr:ABC transporter permease [Mediterranea sp.]
MMKLIWKLLRQHISTGQLSGFFLANLFGMVIVLFGVQFYKDVLPAFTRGDSFMKKEYMVVTKKISTLGSLTGKSNAFSSKEIKELQEQPFTRRIGSFTPSLFQVYLGLGINTGAENTSTHLSTEMFFESVPDEFIDARLEKWQYDESSRIIPIIIPRNYLNLYNFGYAQSRNLPKITEGMTGLLSIDIQIQGKDGHTEQYKGIIAG